jgi:hypothetical protein
LNLSSHDMAVIEQALQNGINQGFDYQTILAYREVLSKMQGFPTRHNGMRVDAVDFPVQQDGFRYDYDDSAER